MPTTSHLLDELGSLAGLPPQAARAMPPGMYHDPGIAARCHRTIYMRDGEIEREERHR